MRKVERQRSIIVDRLSEEVELEDGTRGKLTRNQIAFLKAFRIAKTITGASEKAGFYRLTHYRWHKESPFYRQAFAEMKAAAADDLEEAATQRAVEGVRICKFTKDGTPLRDPRKHDPETGEVKPEWASDPWYYETSFSDRLLELLLKAKKPDEFRERSSVEMSGPGGNPIELEAVRQMTLQNPALVDQMHKMLEEMMNAQSQHRLGHDVDDVFRDSVELGGCDQSGEVLAGTAPPVHQSEAGGLGGGKDPEADDLLSPASREERAMQQALPCVVPGQLPGPPCDAGRPRSDVRGELGGESP